MRNYTASERALIVLGVMVGKTCSEINEILEKDQKKSGATNRTMPQGTYDMLTKRYLPNMRVPNQTPDWIFEVFDHTLHPKSAADLCKFTSFEVQQNNPQQLTLFGE